MPLTDAPRSNTSNKSSKSAKAAPLSTGSSKQAQHLRPSHPSSRRDSNILLDNNNRASQSTTTKTRSLAGTQLSSMSSSPVLTGNSTDHEDSDSDRRSSATLAIATAPLSSTGTSSAARPHYKEGIRLAEMGKWGTLVVRLQKEPQLARHKDHHGMLPLHWACTEDDVPPSVVQALLQVFPDAVLTKNNAQLLPLHIAVRARVCKETLALLCDARPSSLLEATPSGKTALMLADEVGLAPASIAVLQAAERAYVELNEERESTSYAYENTKRDIAAQSQRLRESMLFASSQQHQQQRPSTATSTGTGGSSGGSQRGSIATNGSSAAPTRTSSARRVTGSNTAFFPPTQQSSYPPPLARTASQNSSGFRTSDSIMNELLAASQQQPQALPNNQHDYYGEQLPTFEQLQFHTAPSRLISMDDNDTNGGDTNNGHRRTNSRTLFLDQQQQQQQQEMHALAQHHQHQQPMTQPLTPSLVLEADSNSSNSGVCAVCYKKFSMFRTKYQCKGCSVFLCKRHVAGKVVFPAYGKKRSACGDCYRIYRSDPLPLTGAAAAGLSTAPAAAGGRTRTPSFASSTTTATTIHTARTTPNTIDRHSSLRSTAASSVSSSTTQQHTRASRAASTQSLHGRASTIAGPQTNVRYSVNAAAAATRPMPLTQHASLYSNSNNNNTRSSSAHDQQYRNDSMLSFGETELQHANGGNDASVEIAALQQRVAGLEDQNRMLLTRVVDQEKQYNEAMLLLTETMTRVGELELKLPSLKPTTFGTTSTTSENRESNILGDYDFDFPTPFNEKFD